MLQLPELAASFFSYDLSLHFYQSIAEMKVHHIPEGVSLMSLKN